MGGQILFNFVDTFYVFCCRKSVTCSPSCFITISPLFVPLDMLTGSNDKPPSKIGVVVVPRIPSHDSCGSQLFYLKCPVLWSFFPSTNRFFSRRISLTRSLNRGERFMTSLHVHSFDGCCPFVMDFPYILCQSPRVCPDLYQTQWWLTSFLKSINHKFS